MLKPDEFTIGTLADAQPNTFMKPRSQYDTMAIVGTHASKPAAVLLDGQYGFTAFPSAEADGWTGLLIPNVRIVVDEGSLFDPDQVRTPLGSLVRGGDYLAVIASPDRRYGHSGPMRVSLRLDLAELPPDMKAGFYRWQILLGVGDNERVLHEVDTRTLDQAAT